ncbi:hypothetical protein V6N11_023534 [Hibiscus sabdariffa]|uniref:Uncharacterized protein n=1 Tax=Hibiscus sabdariffa TaxID=183260 RepID=A0ABR2TNF0_9ROSI
MNLDDLFEQKGKITKLVLEELGKGLKYKKGCEVSIPSFYTTEANRRQCVCAIALLNSIQMVKAVKAHADDAFMSCKILKNRSRLMYISFLGIVVRALVPRMNLDDLFEQKGKITKLVLEELGKGLKYKKGCEVSIPSFYTTEAVTTRMGIEEMVAMFLNMVGNAQDAGYPTPVGYIGPYKCERYHLPDFRRSSSFANHNEVFNYYHSSLRCTIERTFGVWKNRRKSETDSEFNRYEGEDMVELDDDDHGSVDPSIRLTVASSTEMDLIRDSIRDQIVEHMKLN